MRPLLSRPLALILLTACGGSSPKGGGAEAGGPPPQLDVCRLVTAEDAARFLGETVGPGTPRLNERNERDGIALANCLYSAPSFRSLNVLVRYGRNETAPASFEALKEATARGETDISGIGKEMLDESQAVDGVGSMAYWVGEMKTLTAFDGHYMVSVTIDPPRRDPDQVQPLAREVMTYVLGRLAK